jgi:hypothetical protein
MGPDGLTLTNSHVRFGSEVVLTGRPANVGFYANPPEAGRSPYGQT